MRTFGKKVPDFQGVRVTRTGRYVAVAKSGGLERKLGEFSTAVEAARCRDEHIIAKRGIESWPILNLQDEWRPQYERAVAARAEQERKDAQIEQERLRRNSIPASRLAELEKAHREGRSITDLARAFDTHSNNVVLALRGAEESRLRSIGLTLATPEPSAESLRSYVGRLFASGTSVRHIAKKLGIDRKTITRWLGETSERKQAG